MIKELKIDLRDDRVNYTPKTKYIISILAKIHRTEDEKIVVFSQFTSYLHYLKKILKKKKIQTGVLDGSVKSEDRIRILDSFREDPEFKIMFCNLIVGANGLNLQSANRMMLIEPYWTSSVENQAIARVARMGQERDVVVYRIVCKNTIEEAISKLADGKKEILDSYISGERRDDFCTPSLNFETICKIVDGMEEILADI